MRRMVVALATALLAGQANAAESTITIAVFTKNTTNPPIPPFASRRTRSGS